MSVISAGLRWKKGTSQRIWSDRRCYENSHKDFWGIKGLAILRKIKGKKMWLWDKGPKQDRQFQPVARVKCAQVMPWEWTEPLVQWEKSKESWHEGSSSYNTAVQDRGTSYPAQLSFVCWSHCFYPDWMKSQAAFCLALLMVLDKCWGKTVTGACQQGTKKQNRKTPLLIQLIKCWQLVITQIVFSNLLTTT